MGTREVFVVQKNVALSDPDAIRVVGSPDEVMGLFSRNPEVQMFRTTPGPSVRDVEQMSSDKTALYEGRDGRLLYKIAKKLVPVDTKYVYIVASDAEDFPDFEIGVMTSPQNVAVELERLTSDAADFLQADADTVITEFKKIYRLSDGDMAVMKVKLPAIGGRRHRKRSKTSKRKHASKKTRKH